MTKKKHKNLLTVGEAAKSAGISVRMLKYYEEKRVITPDVRDEKTGYRWYSQDTVSTLEIIRQLAGLGMSTDEMREYFDEKIDVYPTIYRLERQRDSLNALINTLYQRIDRRGAVSITTLPAMTVYRRSLNTTDPKAGHDLLEEMLTYAIHRWGPKPFTQFVMYDARKPKERFYCVPVPEDSRGDELTVLEETRAAVAIHHGPYSGVPAVHKKIIAWAEERDIKLTGESRTIFMEGSPQHKNAQDFIMQIAMPLCPASEK